MAGLLRMAVAARVPFIVDEPVDLFPELLDHFFVQQMRRSELIHLNVKAFVRFFATLSPGARFLDRQPHSSPQDCIDLCDVAIMPGKMLIRSRL
jgi:hypothetical protein